MQVANGTESPDAFDPSEYVRQRDVFDDKCEEFMRKYLRRSWPIRVIRILGVIQLLICLAILGVDLPIILMFAPRWQVCAGVWAAIFAFIACVSTFHSTRRMTWSKLKWTAALNILAGIAAAVMTAFNILYAVNPRICIAAGGCNYLWYTYGAANSYYVGESILGVAFLLSVFIFLVLFIKYGIGGVSLFESIQNGSAPATYKPMVPPPGAIPVPLNPTAGEGVYGAEHGLPPGYMQQRPPGPMMIRHPNGMMMRPPGVMMMRPPGAMMMEGPRGPIMMPPPQAVPQMPGYYPQPVPQMPGYYPQPGPQPAAAFRYQQ